MSASNQSVDTTEALASRVRRKMVLEAVQNAQSHLEAISLATDEPDAHEVDAADLLDQVVDLLTPSSS